MAIKTSSIVNNKTSRPDNSSIINQQPKNNLPAITQPYIIRSRYNHKNEFQIINTNITSRKINTVNFTRAELQTSYEIIDKLIATSVKIIKEAKTQGSNVADLSWATNQLIATAAEYDNEKYFFINDFINDVIDYCDIIKHDYNAKYKLIDFLTTSSDNLASFLQQHKKHNITKKSTPFVLKLINNIIHFFSFYSKKNMLFQAIANKDNTKVENLLKDIDINTVKNGETLLMCALSHNNIEVVDTLIKAGIDINTCYPNGNSILMEALAKSKNNTDEFANKLINYGADLNIVNHQGNSALMLAIIYCRPNITTNLLAHDADINLVDLQKNSALILALVYNRLNTAKILIEHNANINLKNIYNANALTIAKSKGHKDIVKMLVDTGKITTLVTPKNTALMIASKTHANLEYVKFCMENGADTLNAQDKDGNTALMIALQSNRQDIANLLISFGADITLTNKQGDNALKIAVDHDYTDIAARLQRDA